MIGLGDLAFNGSMLHEYGWRFVAGVRVTAQLVGLAYGLGFLVAWPIAFARMSHNRLLSSTAFGYIAVFRGTPLLCQLYLIYYGAGEIHSTLTQWGLWFYFRDAFFCCAVAFVLNTSAYQAEIFRGAMLAVTSGQREAAAALGLSGWQIARHVVLPQAGLVALRPMGNELVGLIKASALASIVTIMDIMGQTRLIFARTFDFSAYLYAALFYLAITEAVRRLWLLIERSKSRHLTPARLSPSS